MKTLCERLEANEEVDAVIELQRIKKELYMLIQDAKKQYRYDVVYALDEVHTVLQNNFLHVLEDGTVAPI